MTKIQHAYCITALLLLAGILVIQHKIYANIDRIDDDTSSLERCQRDYSHELGHIEENTTEIIRAIYKIDTGGGDYLYLRDIAKTLEEVLAELQNNP